MSVCFSYVLARNNYSTKLLLFFFFKKNSYINYQGCLFYESCSLHIWINSIRSISWSFNIHLVSVTIWYWFGLPYAWGSQSRTRGYFSLARRMKYFSADWYWCTALILLLFIHTYIHTYIHTCVCVCVFVFIYVRMNLLIFMFINKKFKIHMFYKPKYYSKYINHYISLNYVFFYIKDSKLNFFFFFYQLKCPRYA